MNSPVRSSILPWIGVVLCLFSLSVLAPMAWMGVRRSGALPDQRELRRDLPQINAQLKQQSQPQLAQSRQPLEARKLDLRGRADDVDGSLGQAVAVLPPVAEQWERDPSIADTPSLPVPFERVPQRINAQPPERVQQESTPVAPTDSMELSIRTPDVPSETLELSWPRSPKLKVALAACSGNNPLIEEWAEAVTQALDQLSNLSLRQVSESRMTLTRLDALLKEGERRSTTVRSIHQRANVLRAAYALERRLEIWKTVLALQSPTLMTASYRQADPRRTVATLNAISAQLRDHPHAEAWMRYLKVPQLQAAAQGSYGSNLAARSKLARTVLQRMNSHSMTPDQRAFLEDPRYDQLQQELRYWVSEPIHYADLLQRIERYEARALSRDAREIANGYQLSRWAHAESLTQLADDIDTYYRNANLRVAVSEDFLNRLIPAPPAVDEAVDDELMGARVFGRSRTSTRLRLFLMPDRKRWRFGLEAEGEVASETETWSGPATFYNEGYGRYLARKMLQVDRRGMRSYRAIADADLSTDLRGMDTDFDALPIVNMLARAVAKQQYDSRSPEAQSEIRNMVAGRARDLLDEEVEKRIEEMKVEFNNRFYRPMSELRLNPMPMDLETTATRLIARYRLAGNTQLGASTPRPQAPGDSLVSLQIHESAINNVIEQLKLDGRTIRLRDLYQELGMLFKGQAIEIPERVPEDVVLTFARYDAVRVRFDQEKIIVTLALEELRHEKKRWRQFVVRATYKPVVDGQHPRLERDGYVHLPVSRLLNFGDQVAIRGIFSAVFDRHPDIRLLGELLTSNEKLKMLSINQYVVRDGWLGLAVGPHRVVRRRIE